MKKIEGSRKGGKRGFNGSHVKRVMKRKSGTYVLFGKAAWNNKPRAQMMKWLSPKKMTELKSITSMQLRLMGQGGQITQ